MANAIEDITEVFRKVLKEPTLVLSIAMTAADVRGWDSLNHIKIVIAVEKKFGIRFTSAEIQSFRNVGDMVAAVEKRASA